MIGNAHIDPVWLWRWQDGLAEIKATFMSALDRMDETGDFVFTSACAGYYRWVEENAPDMFERIRERVAEGRWRIVGGMWIQPDCNLPSGESFARQLMYGQRYFAEKFGVTAKTGYNVDSFGHNLMLPALLRRAGIENYVFMRPGKHENPDVPSPLFIWSSPDGSRVLTYRIPDSYNSGGGEEQVVKKIRKARAAADESGCPVMCFYGVGNHGGGPTVRNLKAVTEYRESGENGGEVIFSHPDAYFDEVRASGLDLPEWKGELQHHASGCYSANSAVKALNRRAENALSRCERFGVMARRLTGHTPGTLERAWRDLLFCQFHDTLCGCAVREAYADAGTQLAETLSICAREENAALQKISWRIDTVKGAPGRIRSKENRSVLWGAKDLGTPVVVFNPHIFEASAPVQLFGRVARVADSEGREVPVQTVRASRTNGADKWDTLFEARVPPFGYRLYWAYADGGNGTEQEEPGAGAGRDPEMRITPHSMENRYLSADFDPDSGALRGLVIKKSGRQALSGPAGYRMADIEDSDTWAHGVFSFENWKEEFGGAVFEVLEEGPVRLKLRVTSRAGSSLLIQDYALYGGSDQLDVRVRLDMRDGFRMVKFCFPVSARDPVARAETAYGYIERRPDGREETGQRWMELGGEDGGLAALNDGKYSFSAADGELRLTVANTCLFADHFGQGHRDGSCLHQDMGAQEFGYSLVPHDGGWRQAGLSRRGELFNMGLAYTAETYHEGDLPDVWSGMSAGEPGVSAGAVKRAEDGGGYIVRMAETLGRPAKTELSAPVFGRNIPLEFSALEIKTIFVPDDPDGQTREVPLTELGVPRRG